MFTVAARPATPADIPTLGDLYRELQDEMVALKPIWALTDGLPEPVERALESRIESPDVTVYVGEIDGVPVGFLTWFDASLLPQGDGSRMATIEHIFTTPQARRVGVGEAMMSRLFEDATALGIELFDAVVPPGHRDAKNFFESNGFKARRIVMHRGAR